MGIHGYKKDMDKIFDIINNLEGIIFYSRQKPKFFM